MASAARGERISIDDWELAATAPGAAEEPGALDDLGLNWVEAQVPGTAAGSLRAARQWREGEPRDFDTEDWWFRTAFEAAGGDENEQVTLHLGGLATVADVYLNGAMLVHSDSMFVSHAIDVSDLLAGDNTLAIRFHALAPLLAERRKPRARWRTRLVGEANLRFFRTMLLGRAPGFAPGPAAVGPWRSIDLERRRLIAVDDLRLSPRLEGTSGRLEIDGNLRLLGDGELLSVAVELDGSSGTHRTDLELTDKEGSVAGLLNVPAVATWWPHTHGTPALHRVRLLAVTTGGSIAIDAGHVGFRSVAAGNSTDHEIERDGLDLHVNGVRVFARGAVWTPIDAVGMAPSEASLRRALELARDAGMNMVRIPGTSAYESGTFHDLCDELGMLVWQDFMFANFDYPIVDGAFRAQVEIEIEQILERIGRRPSTVVFCGNSEIEQQVAMFGLDPAIGRGELFGELLPTLIDRSGSEAIYVPSAPCGGSLPFHPDVGIANYFGVGGYRRPLEDARRSNVRFAAECLALSNIASDATVAQMADPGWKQGVPRDTGSDWDFEDVRDHYLALLYGVDPDELRIADPGRYLRLSGAVSGEVMTEVFGEWRRRRSGCGGALVLWMRDLVDGPGWGLFDASGEPKPAVAQLRRALAPVAIWTVDEGLSGIVAHVANDRPERLEAKLRVAFYRDLEQRVDEVEEIVTLPPHGCLERNIEGMLGRFVDASYAYRFGPAQQDLIVTSLESKDGSELISQSFRFPAGRPVEAESAATLGLQAHARDNGDGFVEVLVRSRRAACGVRLNSPGCDADDDAFSIEPGGKRLIGLRSRGGSEEFDGATITAINLAGDLAVPS